MRTGALKGRTCKGLAKVTQALQPAEREECSRCELPLRRTRRNQPRLRDLKQMHAVTQYAHLCSPMPNTKPFVVHAGYMAESENIASQIGLAGNDSKCRKWRNYQCDINTTSRRPANDQSVAGQHTGAVSPAQVLSPAFHRMPNCRRICSPRPEVPCSRMTLQNIEHNLSRFFSNSNKSE